MKFSHLFTSLLLVSSLLISCDKEEDTIAVVRIVAVTGLPIEGVNVRLYPEPSDVQANELITAVEQLTNAAGEAVFDFTENYEQGQAGFAVLNIEATQDTSAVEGIIKIDPEVTNEQVLVLQ